MCILDKLNTCISITIIINIFIQLKISFNEDICISKQLGHDDSIVAHLEDPVKQPKLWHARPAMTQISLHPPNLIRDFAGRTVIFFFFFFFMRRLIFVKSLSDCHIVKVCKYWFSFFYRLIHTSKISFFFSRSKIFLCNAKISKLMSFSISEKQYRSDDIFTFSSITLVRKGWGKVVNTNAELHLQSS